MTNNNNSSMASHYQGDRGSSDNGSFYTIISFSAPRFIKESYNLIASSHYFTLDSFPTKINSPEFAKKLEAIYNSNLKIIAIDKDFMKAS